MGRRRNSETTWLLAKIGELQAAPVYTVEQGLAALEKLAREPRKLQVGVKPGGQGEREIGLETGAAIRQVLQARESNPDLLTRNARAVHELYTLLRMGYVPR